jgi:hypothetical protein
MGVDDVGVDDVGVDDVGVDDVVERFHEENSSALHRHP